MKGIERSDVVFWGPINESGPGLFFTGLCRVLSDHGLKVTAITHKSQRDQLMDKFDIIEVHNLRDYLRVCVVLSKSRRTVLAYHMETTPPPFACLLRFLCSIPMVPVIVGSDWFDSIRPRLLSGSRLDQLRAYCIDKLYQMLSQGPSIVASTKEIVGTLNRTYKIPLTHLAVVPGAVVDLGLFMNDPTCTSIATTILFVGRLSSENGVDTLIASMNHIVRRRSDARLVIVGDGPLRSELESLVDRLGISGHVEMVGLVPHRDVPRYMKSATLAAFPFIWRAGAGNVVFEAMAMELPVVISEANETIEELVRAKCVVGVSPCDEEALANGILRLLNDIDLRRSYGATGRRYVQENLSDSQITSIWFTLIHTVRELVHQHSIPGTASS